MGFIIQQDRLRIPSSKKVHHSTNLTSHFDPYVAGVPNWDEAKLSSFRRSTCRQETQGVFARALSASREGLQPLQQTKGG